MKKSLVAVLLLLLSSWSWDAYGQPVFLGEDLSSNRRNALPPDTMQVVIFYDGAGTSADLTIELEKPAEPPELRDPWYVTITGLRKFNRVIETREYALGGYQPTGHFFIEGAVPDGVIDGVAFGVYWKNRAGNYHVLKSNDNRPAPTARFVCGWPLAMSPETFAKRTPQISNAGGRQSAQMAICGAKLLDNGWYFLDQGLGDLNIDTRILTVVVRGGPAQVLVAPTGERCENLASGADVVCRFLLPMNTLLTLTAMPEPGNPDPGFLGWFGDCQGTSLTCEIDMSRDRNVTGRFTGM